MNQSPYVDSPLSEKILTIGLPYESYQGGISMVINTYSRYFKKFKFHSLYKRNKTPIIGAAYYLFYLAQLIFKLVKDKDVQIIHIHGAAKGSFVRKYFAFVVTKRLFGKKVIYHSHGSELKEFYDTSGRVVKRWMAYFFSKVDVIICLSEQWKVFFESNFNVNKIVVLENIVENPNLNQQSLQAQLPLKFLFLGSIGRRKGIFDLLSVLAANKSLYEGQVLLLIGGNGETQKLQDTIKQNGLENLVRFEGWVTGADKARLLEAADIYILPSYNEGLPISILEAMSYKLPVISTPVGGIPEVIKNGLNGFLVTPGNAAEIKDAISWFISNQAQIPGMANKSYEIVSPYFAENVIPRLKNIYTQLLAE